MPSFEVSKPGLDQDPALVLKDVSLSIPVNSSEVRTLKKAFIRSVTGGALRRTKAGTSIEALSNINCTINHGERVALIGHNGAGKSTFLRVISGIYTPTAGAIRVLCSVYPMLTKGFITGPELSGIQAIKGHYLLNHHNLKGFHSYCEDIVNFSGLGDFIHLPMKGYSAGMSARLMFALVTSGSHDCLALDEGIGAGDSEFFDRAQVRLQSFIESAGTLILASHSDGLLKRFCNRGLVFRQGKIVFDGLLDEALSYYHDFNR
ncbi:ATP-binding cassette domain-containing protein [bacterium]|nr:ATP-binding cassette domain-containing protein [bacterium]